MNKWIDYLNGNANVVMVEAVISRERTAQGNELIHVSIGNQEIYQFWNNPDKSRESPKHTGGRKPYILLMIDRLEELKRDGIPNVEELIGFLVCLANNIEWHTGRLINKRSKKSLQYIDLQRMFSFGKRKLDRIIRELKTHGLLSNTAEGYFISTSLIRKGK